MERYKDTKTGWFDIWYLIFDIWYLIFDIWYGRFSCHDRLDLLCQAQKDCAQAWTERWPQTPDNVASLKRWKMEAANPQGLLEEMMWSFHVPCLCTWEMVMPVLLRSIWSWNGRTWNMSWASYCGAFDRWVEKVQPVQFQDQKFSHLRSEHPIHCISISGSRGKHVEASENHLLFPLTGVCVSLCPRFWTGESGRGWRRTAASGWHGPSGASLSTSHRGDLMDDGAARFNKSLRNQKKDLTNECIKGVEWGQKLAVINKTSIACGVSWPIVLQPWTQPGLQNPPMQFLLLAGCFWWGLESVGFLDDIL